MLNVEQDYPFVHTLSDVETVTLQFTYWSYYGYRKFANNVIIFLNSLNEHSFQILYLCIYKIWGITHKTV